MKIRGLFFLFVLFFANAQLNAQQFGLKERYLIDSLDLETLTEADKELLERQLDIYHSNVHDTIKIEALSLLTENLQSEYFEKYELFALHKIEAVANKYSDQKVQEFLLKAYGSSLNDVGYVHRRHGNLERALDYYNRAHIIALEVEDFRLQCSVLNNLGAIQILLGDLESAFTFYSESLQISEEHQDSVGMAMDYNSLAGTYAYMGNDSLAILMFEKALEIYKILDDKRGLSLVTANIGAISRRNGKYEEAIRYTTEALHINEEIGNKMLITNNYSNLARIYQSLGDYKKAQEYAEKSYDLANQLGYPDRIKVSAEVLSEVYAQQGKGMEALEMYKEFIEMRDSLNNLENQKAALEQESKFAYEKQKAVDDAENEKKIAIQQQLKKRQELIAYAAIGGFILVLVFLYFVFNRLKIARKQKNEIEAQRTEIELQKNEIESAHTEITDSIEYAKRIQSAILPPRHLLNKYLPNAFVLYLPKDIVAGDFYWLEPHDSGVLFAAADCTGHGVPGAMVSVVCNNALNRSVREYGLTRPAAILNKTREIVIAEFSRGIEIASEDTSEIKDGMDIALVSLEKMEGKTGDYKLKYAGANNPLWIVRRNSNEIEEIKADKQPVGVNYHGKPFTEHDILLTKGDSFYIFSDGYADQFGGENGKKYKGSKLKQFLLSICEETMDNQLMLLRQEFEDWRGSLDQLDDICIIGVKIADEH